MITLATCSK